MVSPSATGGLQLPADAFDEVFPFHFAFGPDWRIVRCGRSLARVCPRVVPGALLGALFAPVRPEAFPDFEDLLRERRTLFLIREQSSAVLLRGQVVSLRPAQDLGVFLGSPWLPEASAIAQHGLSFDDFAIHDPALDLLHVVQSQKMAVADLKKLAAKLQAQRAVLRERNAQLSRQEAEYRKLALIASRTDNAVVLTDAQGLTEWVNEGFTRLTGYTLAEVRGKKPGTVLQGPETDPATVRLIRDQLAKGEGFSVEILNYSKSGRKYWLAVEVQPIRDEQGRITNFMAVESDVTARREADRALRESQQRLELALSGADLGLWDWDIRTGAVVLDERWAGMLGYRPDEVEPHLRTWVKLLHPDDLPETMWQLERHLRGEVRAFEGEYRLRAKSGEWRWILDRGRVVECDADGHPVRAAGTHLDITARKQAEERLGVQFEISAELARATSLVEVAPNLLRIIGRKLGWEVGAYWAWSPEHEGLTCLNGWHTAAAAESAEFLRASRRLVLPPGVGLPGGVWASRQPAWVSDVTQAANFPRAQEARAAGLRTGCAFPIALGETPLGVMEFFGREASAPNELLLGTLAAVARQVG